MIGRAPYFDHVRAWAGKPLCQVELGMRLAVRDHHPKLVLTLDPLPVDLPDGLVHVDLRRFLAGEPVSTGPLA